jgi:uncharacterized protein YwgA
MSDALKIGLLVRDAGPIEGRKKLQKIVFLLQESGEEFDAHYELSLYGPFSAELKSCVDELVASKLFDEVPASTGGYRYSVKPEFCRVLQRAAAVEPAGWIGLARALNARDPSELEGISTVLFLQSRGWRETELQDRFVSLKPHLADRFHELFEQGGRVRNRSFGSA